MTPAGQWKLGLIWAAGGVALHLWGGAQFPLWWALGGLIWALLWGLADWNHRRTNS